MRMEIDEHRAHIRWAKFDGLIEQYPDKSGFGFDENVGCLNLSGGLFASISLFGRKGLRQKKNVRGQPAQSPKPYTAARGTYAYEVLQKRFKELDKENLGYINEYELKSALKNMNLPVSEKDVKAYVKAQKQDAVRFEEFAEYAINRENVLFETFKELDKRKNGYLTANELKMALQKYHFRFSDNDLTKILKGGRIGSDSVGNLEQNQAFDFSDYRNFLMLFTKKDLRSENERAAIDLGDLDSSFLFCADKFAKRRKRPEETLEHLLAASLSAAVSRTVLSPLESIKISLMADNGIPKETALSVMNRIWRDEGLTGFFKGNLLNIARIIPSKVTEFVVYDKLKEEALEKSKRSELSSVDSMFLGSIASMAGAVVAYPLDTVRTALTVHSSHMSGLQIAKQIVQDKSMYNGLVPNMVRAIPYGVISFSIYDKLQQWHRKKVGPGGELGTVPTVLFGLIAGAAAQTVVHPFEVVQRRLQLEAAKKGPQIYHNMLSAFQVIAEDEGLSALYGGLFVSYLKLVPAAAISVVVYKGVKDQQERKKAAAIAYN